MKKLIICLAILILPLLAEEISLGLVVGFEGNSLILVDGLKVKLPDNSLVSFVGENNQTFDAAKLPFPFTATLVTTEQTSGTAFTSGPGIIKNTTIKIHKLFKVENGRLVEKVE